MTIVTALICVLSPWIGLLFTHNSHVLHLLFIVLAIDTVSQQFMSAVVVDTASIQAGGNSKFPMMVTALGIWLIRTLGVYLVAWRMGFGLPAVWGSIAVDNAVRAGLFAWYRKKRKLAHSLSE